MTNNLVKYLENKSTSLSFFDVCPSELFFNGQEQKITHIVVNFFDIKKPNLKLIPQSKNSRGLDNKIKNNYYLIENISNGNISLLCEAMISDKNIAIQNGFNYLVKEKILEEKEYDFENESIFFLNEKIKVSKLIALAWFSICITIFTFNLAKIAKAINKKEFAILFDLISGDSPKRFVNKEIIQYLIFKTSLFKNIENDLLNNNIERIGIAYGADYNEKEKIKNTHEFVFTDMIARSIYNSIDEANLTEKEKKLSELAQFLTEKGLLKIINSHKLRF